MSFYRQDTVHYKKIVRLLPVCCSVEQLDGEESKADGSCSMYECTCSLAVLLNREEWITVLL